MSDVSAFIALSMDLIIFFCLKRQCTFFGLNFDLRNTESRVHTCLSYSLVVLFVYSEGEESSSYSSVPDLTPNSRSSTADSRNSYGKLLLSLCVFAFLPLTSFGRKVL